MTEPHHAVLTRLTEEFNALSRHTATIAGDLTELERLLSATAASAVPQPVPHPVPAPNYPPPDPAPYRYLPPPAAPVIQAAPMAPPAAYHPPPPIPQGPSVTERLAGDRAQGWIGKLLAVAGVAVTLIGVVLLLVLAAQAGILRPEIRVGAGALLAFALVGVAVHLNSRPGGRVGAVALAATGVAAAYMDVIAVTTIYHWVGPVVGLILASSIGGGGLILARHWDAQQLGLLVLVPLILLAPVLTDGATLLLIGFMLTLSAAALPVQLGKDWVWLHAARTLAVTAPLLLALLVSAFGSADDPWLLGGACGVAALLAITGALILLPTTAHRGAMALLTAAGVLPVLSAAVAVNHTLAALMTGALAACLLTIVLTADRWPGVPGVVAQVWTALAAVSALITVTAAFDGDIAGPVLLALAVVVTVAGRRDAVARWAAIGFAIFGVAVYLRYAPPSTLAVATALATSEAVSTLVASLLLILAAIAIAWSWVGQRRLDDETARVLWACAGIVVVYAVTAFTVTAGVLVGGTDGGFLAGQMAATICWIGLAAGLFGYALRLPDRDARTAPIVGGLALTAAATTKLFMFDLGTLDGIFRVAVFIVVGLILLGMGAGYARSLAQQDHSRGQADTSVGNSQRW